MYGGIMFIERNMIDINLINTQITDNIANASGNIIYWQCQMNTNPSNLCGQLSIMEGTIIKHTGWNNAFQIDLSVNPDELYFVILIEDSSFSSDINDESNPESGILFAFNNELNTVIWEDWVVMNTPSDTILLQENHD